MSPNESESARKTMELFRFEYMFGKRIPRREQRIGSLVPNCTPWRALFYSHKGSTKLNDLCANQTCRLVSHRSKCVCMLRSELKEKLRKRFFTIQN